MDIYDEIEEALEIVGLQSTGDNNEGKVKDMFEYKVLEKAIKRAEKVEELLDLYRSVKTWVFANSSEWKQLDNLIKLKEKELEEMK